MSDSTPGRGGKKARKTSKEAASQERARVKDEKAEARSLKLQLLADTSQSDDHALREACFNGEDEAAARIIRRQPSLVTEVDEDGLSLLGIALLKANVGCVRLLLENGADPNIAKGGGGGGSSRGDSELNTLDAALRSSREEPEAATALVRLLLEHSADPNYNGCDALKHACLFGPIKCVKLLLDAKGTPDASHVSSVIGKNTADTVRPPPARPPSRPAAAAFPPRRRRRPPTPPTPPPPPAQVAAVVLRLLLTAGASANDPEEGSTHTPLMLAAYHNRPRCIKELISNGADPLAHPEMMQPLKIAVEREYAARNSRRAILRNSAQFCAIL